MLDDKRMLGSFKQIGSATMTLCPIALAVGCKKCAVFSVCPVKGLIGDYKPGEKAPEKKSAAKKK
jgi:hypothetical protein